MTQYTFGSLKKVHEVYSCLYDLLVFFEDISLDEDLPSSIRSAFQNASIELNDRYTDIDLYVRYLISQDSDLQPRQYKEF